MAATMRDFDPRRTDALVRSMSDVDFADFARTSTINLIEHAMSAFKSDLDPMRGVVLLRQLENRIGRIADEYSDRIQRRPDPWFKTLLELYGVYLSRPFTARMAAIDHEAHRLVIHPDIVANMKDADMATGLGRRFAAIEGRQFWSPEHTYWLAVKRYSHLARSGSAGGAKAVVWVLDTNDTAS